MSAWTFLGTRITPFCEVILPQKGILVHLKQKTVIVVRLSVSLSAYLETLALMFHCGVCPADQSL